jgi:hypothetical protein
MFQIDVFAKLFYQNETYPLKKRQNETYPQKYLASN